MGAKAERAAGRDDGSWKNQAGNGDLARAGVKNLSGRASERPVRREGLDRYDASDRAAVQRAGRRRKAAFGERRGQPDGESGCRALTELAGVRAELQVGSLGTIFFSRRCPIHAWGCPPR